MQQLVERLSVSRKSVASRLKKLKEKDNVERAGLDRSGYWRVKKQPLGKSGQQIQNEKHGTSKQLRFVEQTPVVPIGYIQNRVPLDKRVAINSYTADGRLLSIKPFLEQTWQLCGGQWRAHSKVSELNSITIKLHSTAVKTKNASLQESHLKSEIYTVITKQHATKPETIKTYMDITLARYPVHSSQPTKTETLRLMPKIIFKETSASSNLMAILFHLSDETTSRFVEMSRNTVTSLYEQIFCAMGIISQGQCKGQDVWWFDANKIHWTDAYSSIRNRCTKIAGIQKQSYSLAFNL